MRQSLLTSFTSALLATTTLGCASAAAATCESLAGLTLPVANTTITAAQSIPAGTYTAPNGQVFPNLPAFCRVAGLSKPRPTSNIGFEVWMPSSTWNGKFEQVGNGGLAGSIVYSGMAIALGQNYATASTDDGTAGDIPGFLLDPNKVADWRVDAVHETAENAQSIVQGFYSAAPRHSYFTGCSKGGSEASVEMQRFPDDFDGIVGGACAFGGMHNQVDSIWNIVQTNGNATNTTPLLDEDALTLLHSAVLAACPQEGGVETDNYLNDPRDCHFNPKVLQCKQNQDPSTCLTAAQVQAAQNLYNGPSNPRTGVEIYPGAPRGQEAPPGNPAIANGNLYGWQTWSPIPPPGFWLGGALTAPTVGGLLGNPNFGYADFFTFDFDKDTATLDAKWGAVYNNLNPDVRPFKRRGGKAIFYQGWGDPLVNPQQQIYYYNSVVSFLMHERLDPAGGSGLGGLEETRDFYRLFMVPGMAHCVGDGPGANTFNGANNPGNPQDPEHDVVAALDRWIVDGVAPEKIIASHLTNGVADATRPLCPYPEIARYKGTGSTTDAANFVCVLDRDDLPSDFREAKKLSQALSGD